MTEQTDPALSPQVEAKTVFWNRVQLALIFVVFLAPIAGAFLYKPTQFNNYGDLYTPAPELPSLPLTAEGQPTDFDALRGQWLFLVVAQTECNENCEQNLLKIRQLRAMQGRDLERIRSVFIHGELPLEVSNDLADKYQPIEVFKADSAALQTWSELLKPEGVTGEALKDRFYIVDGTGLLMISYPFDADPNLIKKDIKRLLKARR